MGSALYKIKACNTVFNYCTNLRICKTYCNVFAFLCAAMLYWKGLKQTRFKVKVKMRALGGAEEKLRLCGAERKMSACGAV